MHFCKVFQANSLRNVLSVVMVLHALIGELQDNLSWDKSLLESSIISSEQNRCGLFKIKQEFFPTLKNLCSVCRAHVLTMGGRHDQSHIFMHSFITHIHHDIVVYAGKTMKKMK